LTEYDRHENKQQFGFHELGVFFTAPT